MERGYVKLWRKAQEGSSWTRGLLYQGLIVNLLMRASWKEASYQGRALRPGQFGAVLSNMAESLHLSRTTLVRMLRTLHDDGFITVENVGNRFCIITITHWGRYQHAETDMRSTDGQPVENQWTTDEQPGCVRQLKEQEVKKLRILTSPPFPPAGGGKDGAAAPLSPGDAPKSASPRTTRMPQTYPQAFEAFWQAYPRKVGKDAAFRVWRRKRHELPPPEELAAILARQGRCGQWQRDGGQYIPHPATWLNQGRWQDEIEGQTGPVMDYPEGW